MLHHYRNKVIKQRNIVIKLQTQETESNTSSARIKVYNTNNISYFSPTVSSEFYHLRKISNVQEICLRFVDLVSELREFGDRQTTVVVVVEPLDKMQSSVLGIMQFVA